MPERDQTVIRRGGAVICALALILLSGWRLGMPIIRPNSAEYIEVAKGHAGNVAKPFSSRVLHPWTVIALMRSGLRLENAFTVVAGAALGVLVACTASVVLGFGGVRWAWPLLLWCPILVEYFRAAYMPDLFHAALLAGLWLALMRAEPLGISNSCGFAVVPGIQRAGGVCSGGLFCVAATLLAGSRGGTCHGARDGGGGAGCSGGWPEYPSLFDWVLHCAQECLELPFQLAGPAAVAASVCLEPCGSLELPDSFADGTAAGVLFTLGGLRLASGDDCGNMDEFLRGAVALLCVFGGGVAGFVRRTQ